MDRIAHSQRHLLSLIEDVLGFTQVEAGRLSYTIEPVLLQDLFHSIESIVGAQLQRKGLSLEVPDPGESLVVQADADKLRQVLLNVVSNAIKFTPSGGRITISTNGDHDRVRIAVTDTGIGIAPDQIDRVFDPFYQIDQDDTRRFPGLGLGLSLVRDAVFAMDGQVEIESREGAGTRVFIDLPAGKPPGILRREEPKSGP